MKTIAFILAGAGLFLWLFPVISSRIKDFTGWSLSGSFLQRKAAVPDEPKTAPVITIDSLEAELGITPDVYLCDRIARINEALIARRDGTKSKKGGVK